jgi:hypothetical protein
VDEDYISVVTLGLSIRCIGGTMAWLRNFANDCVVDKVIYFVNWLRRLYI